MREGGAWHSTDHSHASDPTHDSGRYRDMLPRTPTPTTIAYIRMRGMKTPAWLPQ